MEDKNKITMFGDMSKIKKWYRNLSIVDKRILFIFLGLIIIILLLNFTIETFRNLNDDLTKQECNQLRINDIRYYLELQEENNILAFIYSFQTLFVFLLSAIAISWVLHGVGFHIVKG